MALYILAGQAGAADFRPVTDAMLLAPDPADWLMFSRTYDNQRFSPLDQVNTDNVRQLELVWSRDMYPGPQENIPLVHDGIMYVAHPRGIIQALNAADGEVIWEYRRELPEDIVEYLGNMGRARTLAMYEDKVYYSAPDGFLLALDALTGKLHWEAMAHDYKSGTQTTTGPMVADGKVITGRNCGDTREYCYIAAHDAQTGEFLWRFHTTAGPGEPGGDTWADMPADKRLASAWGLPSSYDPELGLLYWGVANPGPHTRIKRHDGDPFAVPLTAPAELYSNSTLALDADTGKLAWYYQHVPGDDWDADHAQERILIRSEFNPDSDAVKWINPDIPRGEVRDMVVSVGEPGGVWVLDRNTGEFLWTMPFPFDTPDFHVADIDVHTGITRISRDKVLTRDGQTHLTCYQNTKSYWPMAYHPGRNALYIPYHDACHLRTGDLRTASGHNRQRVPRPGSDPQAFAGIARVDMVSGEIDRLHTQRIPGNGSVLLTAGGLMFWGDMSGMLRAFDVDNGEILWEDRVKGVIQTSTITYSVEDRQYLAVMTGIGAAGTADPLSIVTELAPLERNNTIYVFALPGS